MKNFHLCVCVFIAAVALLVFPNKALAIPAFARKYDFRCTMCHVQYPKLNDFGQAYRDNGYRIMGKEIEEKTVFETQTPISLRTSVGYNNDTFHNPGGEENDVRAFQVNGVDVLSGGLFSDRIGYMFVYLPEIEGSRNVVAQRGRMESANAIFSLRSAPTPLSIRVGRFEPAYLAFSAKRSLSVSPYDIYEFTGPNGLALANTQDGIEVSAVLPNQLKLAAGWVNGSEALRESDSPNDFYMRASKVMGQGEGQVVGQRLGVFGYLGKSRLDGGGERKRITRMGADLSLNYCQTGLMIQWLKGVDNKALNTFDFAKDYDFSGGFIEIHHSMPDDIIGFARWDWVNTPSEQDQDQRAWTIGFRYYPAMNIALQVEYAKRKIDHGAENVLSAFEERLFTVRADLAF